MAPHERREGRAGSSTGEAVPIAERRRSTPLWHIAVALAVTAASVAALVGLVVERSPGDPPGTIVVATGRDVSEAGVLYQELIDRWNAMEGNEDHPARLVELSGRADLQHAEMVRWAQSAHTGPEHHEYDVLNLDNQWTAEFARAGWIVPVETDLRAEGFLGRPVEAVTYDGRVWAVPFTADVGMLYYRTDLLETADVRGRTFPELLERLRETAAADGTVEYAYAGQFARYEGLTVNAMEFVWGHGGEIVSEAGRVQLHTPPAREGLSSIVTGLRSGLLPEDAWNDTEAESMRRFADGEALAMRNWPARYDQLAGGPENGAEGTGAGPDFAMVPLPEGTAALGGQSLALTAASQQPAKARELIEFLTAESRQRALFFCGGYAPTRAGAYEGDFHGTCPGEPDGAGAAPRPLDDRRPYAADLRAAVEEARLRPVTPYYPQFTGAFHTGFHDLLTRHGGVLDQGDLTVLHEAAEMALRGA
ncbi:extracellular solute-binding protein [Marinactinospora thermotolerans]|uniref:Multiple sugar transport system substrate-binding protein n=1 Tax=Marinactinospora thermotolerans DSM 45154 TaxID=1122192 RepID=A0A1T4LBZ4_9ACTN|nr:extracellular solute-binding protein [Marinactinospora thermotolerans]SJZ52259.1 multiple sugar transport system substrate-binding protein [Marinactinospora thermotolerans DSM 45154]